MADNYAKSCLLGFMDHLWFHDVILFTCPSSSTSNLLRSNNLQSSSMSMPVTKELPYSSSNDSQTPLISEDDSSAITTNQDYDDEFDKQEEMPTRLNLLANKARSHSSSPSKVKRSRNRRRLQKTMSCKSLCELELEEVKGFMDLGFIFNKEHMRSNKRMMSVIPGLQRLEPFKSTEMTRDIIDDETQRDAIAEEGEMKHPSIIPRPYLSEAWLIKRPDSPLLNLRIPRASTAADMKKHLKYWARTVAFAIALET